MSIKKFLSVILATTMVLSIVACSNQSSTSVEKTNPTEAPVVETKKEVKNSVNLEILKEQDDSMINTYTLLAVNEGAPFVDADGKEVKDVVINTEGADALINWMLSEGIDLAKNFGYDHY